MKKSLLDYQRKQFELEQYWASRIQASSVGPVRRDAYVQAYAAVNALMDQYRQYSSSLVDKAKIQKDHLLAIKAGKRGKFLDIGCARGDLLLQMYQQGWDAFGVDVEGESVAEARRKFELLGVADSAGRVIHGELADMPEGDFDLIFHSDVLEHIHPDDVPLFLQMCYEKTANAGRLVVITPNALVGPSDISRLFLPPGSVANGLHLKEYTLKELNGLLHSAGYEKVASFLFHPSSRLCFDCTARPIYHWLKMELEMVFCWIPATYRPRLLKGIMESMDFSCVIAQKKR